MDGKGASEIPAAVFEFIFVTVTGWTLEYIRNLSEKDFKMHAPLILQRFVSMNKAE